ncbi:MAG: HAD family hydrolase [Chloroflexota bacterium]
MPNITAVLFDFDDTLVDWSRQATHGGEIYRRHIDNVYTYLQAQEIPLPDRETLFHCYLDTVIQAWQVAKADWTGVSFAATMQQTLDKLELNINGIGLDTLLHEFAWQPVPNVVLYPDTLTTLTTLRERGYKLGLITNSMMPMWMRDIELAAYQLLDFFDARVTSGDVGYMKPHPAIYHHVLEQLGIVPEQAVFVGDRPENDIAGANAVGMVSVMMSPPHLQYKDTKIRPNFTIKQLHELLPILAALESEVSNGQTRTE